MPKPSDIRPYTMVKGLTEIEFEYEGKMLTLEQIITKRGKFTNFITWCIDGRLEGYAEIRRELESSQRRKAAMGNTRGKGRVYTKP